MGLGWVGLGWVGLGWVGLGWVGLGWVGLGWVGLGWVGLGFVDDSYKYPPAETPSESYSMLRFSSSLNLLLINGVVSPKQPIN